MRSDYDPRSIPDIEAHIQRLIAQMQEKQAELAIAHRDRAFGAATTQPVWRIREQLDDIYHQYDLAISDLDRRRI